MSNCVCQNLNKNTNMQNQKENLFRNKFRFLNSQEHNDDIKWTESSSSDYENKSFEKLCNDKKGNRKRKRKKKVLNQVSNLDITIIDSSKNCKNDAGCDKSPILKSKRVIDRVSPILFSNSDPPVIDSKGNSPILYNKSFQLKSLKVQLKTELNPGRVKKQLSYEKFNKTETQNSDNQNGTMNVIKYLSKDEVDNISLKTDIHSDNTSNASLKAKLVERVKSFFESNFSSETTSQIISDTPTPTDNSVNEETDIISGKTQPVSILQSIKLESASNSDNSSFNNANKKIKYKKGSLAYRLNGLLKKQNAHVSLWQHERFLAVNSNFVIPKEEFKAFHIQNIDYKYGCYLLTVVDFDSNKYYILINKKYLNVNIKVESVFKLFEPYTILPYTQDFKIIIDVCKFECINLEAE